MTWSNNVEYNARLDRTKGVVVLNVGGITTMMDAPALSRTMSSGRSRLSSGMVTEGVIAGWGGTTLSSRGIDSRKRFVGDVIVDDPDNELTKEHDDDEGSE